MTGAKVLDLVRLFANMPTEDFLARLVKSKAAGASTMMPTAGIETGPEAISKTPVSLPGVVGTDVSEAVVGKGKGEKEVSRWALLKKSSFKEAERLCELSCFW